MTTVLITGGTGYVGSRTAISLAQRGYRVKVVDMVSPKERGIDFPENVTFEQADLRERGDAFRAVKGADVVLHLAADIGPLTYMRDHQGEIMVNNAAIDAAVYPAIVANKIPWVVYSSSSMVFQNPPKYPYVEDDIAGIHPPTNVYGFSKLVGEYFCRSFAAQYGIRYTILRYHNIYGPGEDSKGSTPGDIHVIPALLEKVFSGQYPIELLGDPASTRPFTYVDDAVDATAQIVERAARRDARVQNEDFNIGNDTYYTIEALARKIWELFGDDREFAYTAVPTDAITSIRREVNIKKIRETIGWEPKVSLEDGLQRTAEWVRPRMK